MSKSTSEIQKKLTELEKEKFAEYYVGKLVIQTEKEELAREFRMARLDVEIRLLKWILS